MIPHLDPRGQLTPHDRSYLEELAARGFSGEIRTDYASRLVVATDNSVYQMLPAAVLFPHDEADVVRALSLLGEPRFRGVKLSPRGAGTGTNGQSLSEGIILDVSRHMAAILETDLAAGWVRVQPGVVLDELNAHLKPHGVFFAPNLSPSNRATLGGMISTDASGKGSRVYGKTSEHVLELRSVLVGGELLHAAPIDAEQLAHERRRPGVVGAVYRTVDDVVTRHADRIEAALPKLKRFVTGYDLAHAWRPDGRFDLTTVLCGSEGTLGVLTEAKLRLTKLPGRRGLVAIRYANFDAALRAAGVLVQADPGAIETIDHTIVGLARNDVIWHAVSHLVSQAPHEPPLAAINLVEFESDEESVVVTKLTALCAELDREIAAGGEAAPAGYTVVREAKDIAALWTLRKKGVGLLGNVAGERRPVPFVEDTAVPPERLADYIRDFRRILDRHGLRYGMFGHVDVGCLHVRPALDLRDEGDEALLHQISDQVVELVRSYGGVLWGEHGKGVRGQYAAEHFGPELYALMCRIKGAFDPHDQLNPGKLATPPRSERGLIPIEAVKRGTFDRQIARPVRERFDTVVHCNGNGACFDWSPDSTMCPSFMVTRDRVHSPKGRAGLMREWLRLLAHAGHDAGSSEALARAGGGAGSGPQIALRARADEPGDFSHEVYDAMNGCLACKACATQCPIKVDVPAFRSEFLSQYHQRYRRPLKDYFVAALELSLRAMALWPRLSNALLRSPLSRRLLERVVGIVDTPLLAERSLSRELAARGAEPFDERALAALSAEERARTVLVVQDAFTTFYEPQVALAAYDLLSGLGRRVVFLPYLENGKGLHVKGFLGRFARVAASTADTLARAHALGIPLVGLEPAVTLTYRDEYVHALGPERVGFKVELLQEHLSRTALVELASTAAAHPPPAGQRYRLFGHCTERTAAPASQTQWQQVFRAAGAELEIVQTGCCGMCGAYGHEAEHLADSRRAFELSWAKALSRVSEPSRANDLVTGSSCRSQLKRFAGRESRHPVEVLAERLRAAPAPQLPASSPPAR